MSRKKFAGSKPEPREKPTDDKFPASENESETEHVEDEGEPWGNNFA